MCHGHLKPKLLTGRSGQLPWLFSWREGPADQLSANLYVFYDFAERQTKKLATVSANPDVFRNFAERQTVELAICFSKTQGSRGLC